MVNGDYGVTVAQGSVDPLVRVQIPIVTQNKNFLFYCVIL